MADPNELEILIRSLLVSSPTVMTASKLFSEYQATEGHRFPFRQLGFNTFVEYLQSIPTVVKVN